MDAISNIGGAIGTGVSDATSSMPTWQKILGLGSAGAGAIGNIFASNKRNQVLNQQLTDQQNLMNIANNPQLLAQNIQSVERPLSNALTASVGNSVQGYLGERGLSQAPGITTEALAQGLAPFQQQQQQMAIQAYLQSLGLPAQAAARFLPYPTSTPLNSLFQSLFKNTNGTNNPPFGSGGGNGVPGTGVANLPNLQQLTGIDTGGQANPAANGIDPSLLNSGSGGDFNFMDFLMNNGGGGTGLVPATS